MCRLLQEPATLSLEGLQLLIKSISSMRQKLNRKLTIEGIVINKVDLGQVDDRENISDLREAYGKNIHIYDSMIPKSVRVGRWSRAI